MNSLEKSRFIRAMKVTTDVILFLLVVCFVLCMASVKNLYFASGDPVYIYDEYKELSLTLKIIYNFLVTGKLAIFVFILFQLRQVFQNLTSYHPFEIDNIRRVRFIGKSIIVLSIFPFIKGRLRFAAFTSMGLLRFYRAESITILLFEATSVMFIGIIVLVVAEVFH